MAKTHSGYSRGNTLLKVAYAGFLGLAGVFFVWSFALGGWKDVDLGLAFWAFAACFFLALATGVAGAVSTYKAKGHKTDG